MLKFFKTNFLPLVFLTFVILLLTRHIWSTRGWIETHDGIFHVIRLESFVASLQSGEFPVRWAGNLDNGYGLPLFNFVYPLPYYLGSPFLILGLSSKWVIKLLGIAAFALGAYGFYLLGSQKSRRAGLVASLVFLTTPYLLVNLFVRGALGELWALSLFPWSLLTLAWQRQLLPQKWFYPLPLALMLLAHNFLGFILLALYFVVGFIWQVPLKKIIKTTLLALGLSAFFVFPMILERHLIHSGASLNFTYTFRDHYVYPWQLITSPWGLGHSVAGTGDGFSLQLGLPHLLLLILAFLLAFRTRSRGRWIYLAVIASTLFLMFPLSEPVWELLPPLQIMQFPWRLLGIITVLIPLIYTSLPLTAPRFRHLTFILLLVAGGFAYYYTIPFYYQNNTQFASQLYIHRNKTTTSSRLELLPRWATTTERWLPVDQIRISSGNASLSLLTQNPTELSFALDNSSAATELILARNYYPSWRIVDEAGVWYPLAPTDTGELSFRPPIGSHTYTLVQKTTGLATMSNLISLLTLLLIVMQPLRTFLKNRLDRQYAGWDLSIALRYLPIVDDLKRRVRPTDKILEVGSEITGITPYYPRPITGLDQGFDYTKRNRYLKPVVGSATNLPFKDQSFDYVLSVDCLEHIPTKLRRRAVREMLRVTKKRLYLTFPVGKSSEATDAYLDDYFYQKNGSHFTYLREHVENGLPDADFIPQLLAQHPGWQLRIVGNTSLWLWKFMLKLGLSNEPRKTSLYRRLLFFTPILKKINFAPTYRQLYLITRE